MAIIVATINTDEDELSVTVNGSAISDVSDVSMYCCLDYDGDKHSYVSIGSSVKNADTGLVTRTYISKAGVSKDEPKVMAESIVARATAELRGCLK